MRQVLHRSIVSSLTLPGFVFLLGTLIALGGCGDNSKGACTRGSGITRTCGDDFTRGQCGLINGRFLDGRTCRDLGFSGRIQREEGVGIGRTFNFTFSDVSEPTLPIVIGTATVSNAVEETPLTVIKGNVPITLQIRDMIGPDGLSINEAYNAACPNVHPMPEEMIVEAGDWIVYGDPESKQITALFKSNVANQNFTFRLDMDEADYKVGAFSFLVSNKRLVNWNYSAAHHRWVKNIL